MPQINNIISYFRDCYFEDRQNNFIKNVFNEPVEFLHFLTDKENLITGKVPSITVDSKYAQDLQKSAYVYRKEKEILYCTLFLVGTSYDEQNEKTTICAPLLYQPATIIQEDTFYCICLEEGQTRFNYRLIEELCQPDEFVGMDEVQDMLADGILEIDEFSQLVFMLEKILSPLDINASFLFPTLNNEKEVRATYEKTIKSNDRSLALLPASCIALFKKSLDSKGILQELTELSKQSTFSEPMRVLLEREETSSHPIENIGLIPGILSQAQTNVVASAAAYPNTLVIGPPGTGKSYTIATLAMNYLSLGKSVLISSARDQAVDVIAAKIEEQLEIKDCIVRGGTKGYLKKLKKFLADLLNGLYSNSSHLQEDEVALSKNLKNLIRTQHRLGDSFMRNSAMEIKMGQYASQARLNMFERLHWWVLRQRQSKMNTLWTIIREYCQVLDHNMKHTRQLISVRQQLQLEKALKTNRETLNTFLKGIRARTGGRKEDLFQKINFRDLLEIFPVWLVKLNDLHRVLPLEKEMFDIVIIDEATQCNIASCLPLIQRAKKVVITGDPNQLKHVSFLSKMKMKSFLDDHDIGEEDRFNYRTHSILDLYSDSIRKQENVLFLNEHFRSLPEIIRFSNTNFYRNRLFIMTEKPLRTVTDCVEKIKCEGRRDEKGINAAEAKQIVKHVLELMQDDKLTGVPSMGILSPFRNQVDYILKQIKACVSLDLFERHKLLVGTAHAFQGEERDIMLLSFVVDDDSHANVLRFLQKPDVFNVSITRARLKQYIYYSVTPDTLPMESLLRKYLFEDAAQKNFTDVTGPNRIFDGFAREVQQALQREYFDVRMAFPMAGMMMDLVIGKNDKTMAIDLIGCPGDFAPQYTLDRYRMFKRAQLTIFPISYTFWRNSPDACVAEIKNAFSEV